MVRDTRKTTNSCCPRVFGVWLSSVIALQIVETQIHRIHAGQQALHVPHRIVGLVFVERQAEVLKQRPTRILRHINSVVAHDCVQIAVTISESRIRTAVQPAVLFENQQSSPYEHRRPA